MVSSPGLPNSSTCNSRLAFQGSLSRQLPISIGNPSPLGCASLHFTSTSLPFTFSVLLRSTSQTSDFGQGAVSGPCLNLLSRSWTSTSISSLFDDSLTCPPDRLGSVTGLFLTSWTLHHIALTFFSMDHEDPRRRHASNGSLHSAFSRASSRPGRSTFPRTPRRNRSGDADVEQRVTETPGFLRSPGPLESMLKTTTETGDIGLFSIRPNGLSAAQRVPGPPSTYHGPPRPRPSLPSMQHPRPARHTHYAEEYHDDRRRLPSTYRDTTSEILSLYGADTPRSNAQSLSPSVDDPRSYSITTTSSRQDPHRSTGTPQSYQGSGESQRSHSPFPYPTRLKRPGVRPSSPAVTEAGASDYGRMIRQDRTSHVSLSLFMLRTC